MMMRRWLGALLAATGMGGWARSAHAARGEAAWATLDRGSRSSQAYLAVGAAFPDPGWPDLALRLDTGLSLLSRSGWGFYGNLPLSVAFDGPSEAALGNLDLGALYASGALVWRAGLVLGTADESPLGAAVNALGLATRLTDTVTARVNSPWLRLSVSPQIARGALLLRFDGGLDLSLDGDDGTRAYGRLNGALGVRIDRVVVSGELATLHYFGETASGSSATLALGASVDSGSSQPYFAVVWPLGDAVPRVDIALTAGVRWAL